MSSKTTPSQLSLLKAKVKVPQDVVYRTFPSETVVLNLKTGKYHGLNPTAGRMLEMLERADSVLDASEAAASDYDQPQAATARDMCKLCEALLARDLIEIDGDNGSG